MATDNGANELQKSETALKEEEILKRWEAGAIFQKVLAKDSPEGEFIFYEGPPTANGRPGIHHLISRTFKDAIPRYKTMRGYHVRRKAGWDTHGLPVEIETEKQLGLTSKKQIEEYGIAAFNEKCKESVWKYVDEWQQFTKRIGYWVDLGDAYVTYYPEYIESVWWIIQEVAKKGLLYRDYKVVPWCPRCGTGLSSHELAQGYADVKDLSVYVKFKMKGEKDTYFLAWTTTPWTLPGNVALAVGEDIIYVKVQKEGETLILAKERMSVLDEGWEITDEMRGAALVGLEYEPLYDFLHDRKISADEKEAWDASLSKAWKVYGAKFVTTTDGTGIVHTAVMYGQDDFELGNAIGLPKYHLVDETGHFIKGTGFFEGRFVKEEATDVEVIKDLAARNLLFKKEKHEHSYPFCWRCKTPLIYYARTSWYIAMSQLREQLVKENEKINWVPEHIKEGRFGEWLREVKDWAISRDRYWGTPLPVWECPECDHKEVIGSVDELLEKSRSSGNNYTVMRHGESLASSQNMVSSKEGGKLDRLTDAGKEEVAAAAKELKHAGIDLIICSPFTRTRETVAIVAQELGIENDNIIVDERLHEMNTGIYNDQSLYEWAAFLQEGDWYTEKPEGGENHAGVRRRVTEALYDLEARYSGKHILIVTHGAPAQMLFAAAARATAATVGTYGNLFRETAQHHELPFKPYPHNENFELDLHKPYIDDVTLVCPKCANTMHRTSEVMDVWLDSGAMPFAQDHYPFENKEWIDHGGYPADYISEAIDQTRGWFYTLHAVGTLVGRGHAYKNVICLGHILDAQGKKMSKSVGNVVNPWDAIAKWGVDVLRYWMFSVNAPGESKNFDEKTVAEMNNKVFTLLRNVAKFYAMHASQDASDGMRVASRPSPVTRNSHLDSMHVLDLWIRALLAELVTVVTDALEKYDMFTATRALREFSNDLSTWYVRRSRDRFKSDDQKDAAYAVATLRFVLLELSKLFAPFTPFFAEELYAIAGGADDSVHLENWPKAEKIHHAGDLITGMMEVRRIVSLALEARMGAGIKVRQPLASLKVRLPAEASAQAGNPKSELREKDAMLALIRDEVNVKEVIFDDSEGWEVELDTVITPQLKEEGDVRELIRALQDFRKQQNLTPSQKVSVNIKTTKEGKALVEKYMKDVLAAATLEKVVVTDDLPTDQTNPIITLA